MREKPHWELGKWKYPLSGWKEKRELSHVRVCCWRNIMSCFFVWYSLIFSLHEVPTRIFSHLPRRLAYPGKRCCTRKIKARENQARKVGNFASRGRQTTLQEGPHPRSAIHRKSRSVTTANYGEVAENTLDYYCCFPVVMSHGWNTNRGMSALHRKRTQDLWWKLDSSIF